MAAGVPVVQPRAAAFPELIEATGGGILCAPNDPQALAGGIESLLLDPERARALGQAGSRAVLENFSAESMARASLRIYEQICSLAEPQPSTFNPQPASWWRELFWPCPQAWAGLAAVWVLILALNSVTREPAPAAQSPNAPRAPEVLMALRDHRRLLAELIESPMEVEPPKPSVPGPRTQLPQRTVAV